MVPKLPTSIIVVFLMLVCLNFTETSLEKDKLYVGIIFPRTGYLNYRRSWGVFFNFVRVEINNNKKASTGDDFLLEKYYNIDHVKGDKVGTLRDYFNPQEVLNMFCETMLNGNQSVSVLLYMGHFGQNIDNTAQTQYLLQFANYIGLPVISWTGEKANTFQVTTDTTILNLTPSLKLQAKAALDLLRKYKWTQFSILTTQIEGAETYISALKDQALTYKDESRKRRKRHKFNIISTVRLPDTKDETLRYHLNALAKTETRIIILYTSQREAQEIFKIVPSLKTNIIGEEYLWIFASPAIEKNTLESFYPVGSLGISYGYDTPVELAVSQSLRLSLQIWRDGMEKFLEDREHDAALNKVSVKPNLSCNGNSTMKWKDGPLLYRYMRNATVEEDAFFWQKNSYFNEEGQIQNLSLEIMNLNKEMIWVSKGHWKKEGIKMEDITWPGLKNVPPRGKPAMYHLKIVTLYERPYIMYNDPDEVTGKCSPSAEPCRIRPENKTISFNSTSTNGTVMACCSGLCIDLLKELGEKLSFTFDLFEVEDKKWGGKEANNQFNGLVGALMNGKADMSMTSLKITPERNQAIDFSVPFLETGITIVVAVREGVISPTAFLEPFDVMSWVFILIMCIQLVALTVFVFEWLSPYGYNRKNMPPREPYDYASWCLILVFSVHASGAAIFIFEWLSPRGLDQGNRPIREHRFSLFRSFWLIWAMLFGAAVNTDNPRGMSSRFMVNVWALFAVVFTASYTANLAAFMITKEDYDKLSGINDWRLKNPYALKPPFKYGTVRDGATEANLKKNFEDMYKYMKNFNKSTVAEGVKAVKNNEINAFIYDATVLEYLSEHDDGCKLRMVGSWYAMTGYGIGFPRGSKWKEKINKHMIDFQYNGFMERLQKFWLTGACRTNHKVGESSKPLGILNFTSAFILLAGGMLLGGILLLLEHVYFQFFRTKLRKWDRCGCCGLVSLSVGKSLTFEQSVREAIELHRNFRCKSPICETQMWKVKHELDLALLKVDRLQRVISERRALPRSQTEIRGPTAIGWHGNDTEVGQPPPIGWKKEYLSPPDYAQTQELARTDVHNTQTPSVIGSRSLPSSPYKTSPQRRSELEDDAAVRASDSEYDARDGRTDEALTNPAVPSTSATAADGHRPADRKRRFHNGAYYVEIGGEMPVEMETVL